MVIVYCGVCDSVTNMTRSENIPNDRERNPKMYQTQLVSTFAGLFSRNEAEDSLADEKEGTFMVRIAERLWSYTISCKTNRGIKHYFIDASHGNYYQLVVNDHTNHYSLGEFTVRPQMLP